jgi:hypothetical protein
VYCAEPADLLEGTQVDDLVLDPTVPLRELGPAAGDDAVRLEVTCSVVTARTGSPTTPEVPRQGNRSLYPPSPSRPGATAAPAPCGSGYPLAAPDMGVPAGGSWPLVGCSSGQCVRVKCQWGRHEAGRVLPVRWRSSTTSAT